jgi:hypothetical protein
MMGKGKDKDRKHKGKKADKGDAALHIPKPLRKAGKEALKLARQPVVSEVVAAALLSAAAALRENKAVAKAGAKNAGKAADAAAEAGREASKLGDAMRGLALDLARRTLDSWDRQASGEESSDKKKKAKGRGRSAESPA